MRGGRGRWVRWLAMVGLTMPLLQSMSCLDIAERSLINGFFGAFNAVLTQQLDATLNTGNTP